MNRPLRFLLYSWLLLAIAAVFSWAQTPTATPSATDVVRFDPALDAILSADAKLEMLPGEGFQGGEGPVWVVLVSGFRTALCPYWEHTNLYPRASLPGTR